MSLLLSRRDVDFLLFDWLDTESLVNHERYADLSRAAFDELLDLAEQLAEDLFAPHNRANDLNEPQFDGEKVVLIDDVKRAVTAFAEADLLAAPLPPEVGGMNVPEAVHAAALAYFYAANPGTAAYELLTLGNVRLLLEHGSPDDIERYVRPMIDGRFFGTMCLSEPQAGSSLADITTRAEPQRRRQLPAVRQQDVDLRRRARTRRENIVHLVLAKIPGGPAGREGHLAVHRAEVPGQRRRLARRAQRRGARRPEPQDGLSRHGQHRCSISAKARSTRRCARRRRLPGRRAAPGLACMFHMMNEARIGVGLGAVLLGYTGYLQVAGLRAQTGRRAGRRAPRTRRRRRCAIIEHADVRRMLLAQKSYVEGGLALCLYCARAGGRASKTDEDQAAREQATCCWTCSRRSPRRWPSQWCLEANNLAIQVHGGYGYTRDYTVEQFYRDNRLNPIHEGTHGIQGLDLLGRKCLLLKAVG